jgi:pyruvate/2-oxoglutarate dehydrogenase complex dihydrolipoamide acyltransferase (E2) component
MSDQEFTSSYQVVMPRLGLTMVNGKIVEWYKKDGDLVEKDEPLFSIENEKATLDIESPATGKLEIQVAPDIVVPILSPVAIIYTKEKSSSHHAGQ